MSKYLLLIALTCSPCYAERINISNFDRLGLTHWEAKIFQHKTDYQLRREDGRTILHASANSSASGLVLKQKIDLRKTPYLHWQWKVPVASSNIAEQTKAGDDFSARIYLIVSAGVLFWQTRALNYVWASKADKLTLWDNPYSGQAKMLALRNEHDIHGAWQQETRNVRADLRRAFGDDISHIDAITIMTDSDNTQTSKHASYAEIWFSSDADGN